jgi:hypothetical protein
LDPTRGYALSQRGGRTFVRKGDDEREIKIRKGKLYIQNKPKTCFIEWKNN